MTDSGEVLLEVDGGVAVVTLNAPDRRNALTPGMAAELIATFDEVDGRGPTSARWSIKAVGKSFCAGGDIATLTSAGQDPAAPEAYEGMGTIYDSFYRLGQVRVPTVAAVRGSAVGAGMNMLLATDLRIVAVGRPAALRLPQARHAPGRRALRDPVAADRPGGRGGDGAVRRGDQRHAGGRARARVGGGRRRRRGGRARWSWPPGWPPTRSWRGRRWATSARRSSTARSAGTSRCSTSGRPRCGRCAARPSCQPPTWRGVQPATRPLALHHAAASSCEPNGCVGEADPPGVVEVGRADVVARGRARSGSGSSSRVDDGVGRGGRRRRWPARRRPGAPRSRGGRRAPGRRRRGR